MSDDPDQGTGYGYACLVVLIRREEVDDPGHGFLNVRRVERRDHEVARFGCLKGRLDSLQVSNLTDEDDVGILTHGGAQRGPEPVRIHPDLALGDDRLIVRVQDLDRVLDREDVTRTGVVDVTDDRAGRGGLAGRSRARDQQKATMLVRQLLHRRW